MRYVHLFAILIATMLSQPVLNSIADGKPKKSEAKIAKNVKSYSEEEFLNRFSHKSRKQISDALGKPVRVAQGSKPSGAEATLARPLDKDKPSNVEMWYYEKLVRYDEKHTYKTVELTFLNDRCENITYFNQ